jgi:hypothetical protein
MTSIDELGRAASADLIRSVGGRGPSWRPAQQARRRRVRHRSAVAVTAVGVLGAIALTTINLRTHDTVPAGPPPPGWVRQQVDVADHSAFGLDVPAGWRVEPTDSANVYEIYRAGEGSPLLQVFEQQVGRESLSQAAQRTAAGIRQKGGTVYSVVPEPLTRPAGLRIDYLLGNRQAEFLIAGQQTLLSIALVGPAATDTRTGTVIATSMRVSRWGPPDQPRPQRTVHAGLLTLVIPTAWRDVSGRARPVPNAGTDLYDADGTDANLRVLFLGPIASIDAAANARRDTLRQVTGHPVAVTHPRLDVSPVVQFDGLQSPQPGDPTSRWLYRNYLVVGPDGRGYLVSLGGPDTSHTRAVFDGIGRRLAFSPVQ